MTGATLPITADRITRLREFGLSEYAARSYLALLDLGVTEARDVSALSKVPASKIYHILDQLHEKGLVNILPEFPRKYAPVPFGEFLQRIHDEHEAAAGAIRRERELLTETFAVMGDVSGGDRGGVMYLRGRRNVLERFAETLASARNDALVLLSAGQAADPRSVADPLRAAGERGITIRRLDAADPRLEGIPTAAFALVVDGRLALLGHALPDDGHASEGNDTAIALDQEGIVALLAGLLESQWRAASARGIPVRTDTDAATSAASEPLPPTL